LARAGGVLAVGTYGGNVAVFDVKSRSSEPIITSDGCAGKHLDPVWQIQWQDTGPIASTLVSISTDGRVTRWKITKGLEYGDLMKLRRTQRRDTVFTSQRMTNMARGLKQDAFISRLTAGTAFDFSPEDERVYIAGAQLASVLICLPASAHAAACLPPARHTALHIYGALLDQSG
jgi:WD40 repeat protein